MLQTITMVRLTLSKLTLNENDSIRAAHRSICAFYDLHRCPSQKAIRRIIDKFRTTYSWGWKEEGIHVTVNEDRYHTMINDFFKICRTLILMRCGFNGMVQPVSEYNSRHVETKFDEKIISRNEPVNWPQRSCDLGNTSSSWLFSAVLC